jgi:heat shock protein HspQ
METAAKLGSYVCTKTLGYTGIVFQKHHNYCATGYSNQWFECQHPPVAEHLRELPWYPVLLSDSGPVLDPEADLAVWDDPAAITNPWYDFCFKPE